MVGTFPPPVHGMSLVNSVVRDKLIVKGAQPIIINLSPKSLKRNWLSRLARISKVINGFILFIKTMAADDGKVLYLGLSGGYGQLYDVLFVGVARLFGRHIFLHHHSYAYLNKPSLVTRLIILAAGSNAMHIALCEGMSQMLKNVYKKVNEIFIVSNAAVVNNDEVDLKHERNSLKVIGFFGNISWAKGIVEFLDVAGEIEKHGASISAMIAGQFEDEKVETKVRERLSRLSKVEYVGPKYGDDKTTFYNAIDVLLFPTRYVNEAEPLTIHEAMRHGVPVITWSRGCISSIITSEAGVVINQQDDFVEAAVRKLLAWVSAPASFSQVSREARKRFSELHRIHKKNLENLCVRLIKGSMD